jgi:hypothetical protein
MSNPSLSPWKGVTPIFLGNPTSDSVTAEPSGLTIYTDKGSKWLFMVSDNGMVAKAVLPSNSTPTGTLDWTVNPSPDVKNKAYDYESVTFANGNLMIGVEGDRDDNSGGLTKPVIKRFDQNRTSKDDPAGDFTGSTWTLNGIDFGSKNNAGGMEAMTLVPYGKYPSNWTDGAPHYGGIFFAAVQANYGRIYVYELPQGHGNPGSASLQNLGSASNPLQVPTVTSAPSGSKPLISDMFFDVGSNALYVLYDGGKDANGNDLGNDYLQKLTISTSNSATGSNALTKVWDTELPWTDCEGLAVDGNTLYLAIDVSSSSSMPKADDGVYVLPGILSKL